MHIPPKLALLVDSSLMESARAYATRHTPSRPDAALRGLVYAALNAWVARQPRTNLGGVALHPGRAQWLILEPPAELTRAWVASICGANPSNLSADALSASLHHALSEHLQHLQRTHHATLAQDAPVSDDLFSVEDASLSLEDALASIVSIDENAPAPPPSPSTRPKRRANRDADIPAIFSRAQGSGDLRTR